mmetsp:Transcript_333/g.661  ORF Transcript_333/g.661 Transcript_333/m.661 type:complete len:129 (+) Transcript_333:2286-2672(+)
MVFREVVRWWWWMMEAAVGIQDDVAAVDIVDTCNTQDAGHVQLQLQRKQTMVVVPIAEDSQEDTLVNATLVHLEDLTNVDIDEDTLLEHERLHPSLDDDRDSMLDGMDMLLVHVAAGWHVAAVKDTSH